METIDLTAPQQLSESQISEDVAEISAFLAASFLFMKVSLTPFSEFALHFSLYEIQEMG